MSRLGTSNFREKDKSFMVQEETWRATVERERTIEAFGSHPHGGHARQTTYADLAARSGPSVSTAHATHSVPDAKAVVAERPAGKASAIGVQWGIQ
mmetsp:Transcript_120502/g.336210  ORF Transcript_120502/g.336210 Transcript_120502/m.336210 type:complete len:96 (-) Transcript_120502:104-391(-)